MRGREFVTDSEITMSSHPRRQFKIMEPTTGTQLPLHAFVFVDTDAVAL